MAGTKRKQEKHGDPPLRDAADPSDTDAFIGPSPNPATNLLLADIALRSTGVLVRHGLERGLLGKRYAPEKARKILKGRTMGESIFGMTVARIALSSVPGALMVGGGLIAKTLYDRRKGKTAERKGEAEIDRKVEKGEAKSDTGKS